MPAHATIQRNIVVAGDIMVDHYLYEGSRLRPTGRRDHAMLPVRKLGGAAGVKSLLDEFIDSPPTSGPWSIPNGWKVHLGTTEPNIHAATSDHHAFAIWRSFNKERDNNKAQVWRADPRMWYSHTYASLQQDSADGDASKQPYIPRPAEHPVEANILVLDDAGIAFRQAERATWLLPHPQAPTRWILLKLSGPMAESELWTSLTGSFADKLVCIVSADDLRSEFVELSRGLSWERTVEDLRKELLHNKTIKPLMDCRHLIVTFSIDGALWIDQTDREQAKATLFFDAGHAEGEHDADVEGKSIGYMTTMAASVAYVLAQHASADGSESDKPDLPRAIEAGLTGMRNLKDEGHGVVVDGFARDEARPDGFPFPRIAGAIFKPSGAFSRARIPWSEPAAGRPPWNLVEASQRPLDSSAAPSLLGLARQVMIQGHAPLKRVPHARFTKLMTADRREIETLRSIRSLMLTYRANTAPKRPLSIGVFGPPGAGKSFGVKQLATEVFGKEAWLDFNLSQFTPPTDMIGALHQVRDRVLSNMTPVIFWDEFDSREYEWLQYLLAPMQDGRFQDKQLNHAVGKCVFIFAGGTSPSFDDFGPPVSADKADDPDSPRRRFELRKGPDFKSRLDAYYDVLGPNQRQVRVEGKLVPDQTDVAYPLRRALLIREQLNCKADEHLDIDPDLLDALLLVSEYRHGARSVEKLVEGLRRDGGNSLRQSWLPPQFQRQMNVDVADFDKYLNRDTLRMSERAIQDIAKKKHAAWQRSPSKRAGSRFDKVWEKLSPVDQEENRTAARRVSELLGLVGLGVRLSNGTCDGLRPADAREVRAHLKNHLERLAEAEHDGWMAYRLQKGWKKAEATNDDPLIQTHNCLVPYVELTEDTKDKDRLMICGMPKRIIEAGYKIVWL